MDGRTISVPLVWYPRLLEQQPPNNEKNGQSVVVVTVSIGQK